MIKGEGKYFELIRCKNNAEWLEQRRLGIGGSDVSAIMGMSKYKSAYALWAEKVGLAKMADISDKPAVYWGTVLEPVVGAEYEKHHPEREVRRVNAVCKSIKRPWAQASLDYEVKDEKLGWGVLEIKTAGLMRAKDWENGIPLYYQTQIAHYLSVLNRPFADVAVLIGGQDYREFRYMRDKEDEKALVKAVDTFWHDYVEASMQPPISSTPEDALTVLEVHAEHDDDIPEWTGSDSDFRLFLSAKAEKERAEEAYKQAANNVKAHIGDHKGLNTPFGKFTWVRSESQRFDAKAFDKAYPDLRTQYMPTYKRDGGIRYTEPK